MVRAPAASEADLTNRAFPIALIAGSAAPRARQSNYPEPFASRMQGREKRPLGDVFGVTNFGVNLTTLAPAGVSSLRHAHSRQDEFIYVLEGNPILCTDEGETQLMPGMCAGFRAGSGNGHCLVNRTDQAVVFLEIGDRSPGDSVTYSDDDIQAHLVDGSWQFTHKNGAAY